MINVTTFGKAKSGGSGGNGGGGTLAADTSTAAYAKKAQYADQSAYADEAAHAAKADLAAKATDLAADSPVRELFLSKKEDDTAAGNITFAQDISVKGNLTAEGNAAVTGETELTGKLTAHGEAEIQGDLTAKKDAAVSGGLTVNGAGQFGGKLSANADFSAAGEATIGGKLTASDEADISGKLTARGTAIFKKDTQTDGAAIFNGKIIADGGLTATDPDAGIPVAAALRSPEYAEGYQGSGWRVDSQGDTWLDSLHVRRFLEVPELRYNRATVIMGDEWQSPGGGIIESAEATPDGLSGTATLKLEDGEIGAVSKGDICMGYWHFEDGTATNETADTDSGDGNMTRAGFATVYFRILSVSDGADGAKNGKFAYALRGGKWTAHPKAGMHFAVYGSFTDTERQKSVLRTRTYTRYLANVSDWNYSFRNVMMQLGDLSGLKSTAAGDLSGYSAYLSNVYFTGILKQIRLALPQLRLDTGTQRELASGAQLTVNCTVWAGEEEITSEVKQWTVSRDSGDPSADLEWNNAHAAAFQATGGTAGGHITLTEADLGAEGTQTLFTFTASGEASDTPSGQNALVTIENGETLYLTDSGGATLTAPA